MSVNKHYKFGGSTAARTLACPAWQIKRQSLPKALTAATSNIFADRGTLLHEAMEEYIRKGNKDLDFDSAEYVGTCLNDAILSQEDIDEDLNPAIDAYDEFCEQEGVTEEMPEIDCYIDDEIGGTCDVLAYNADTVYVFDHKFGYNYVSPEESAQGLFYAMCAREDAENRYDHVFTPERVNLVIGIIQPANAAQDKDIVQVWRTDMERLNAFSDEFFDSLDEATEADLNSGGHCKYCPVTTVCPEKTGLARKALLLDTTDIKHLSVAMTMVEELEEWCKSIKAAAHNQADLGNKIDGYKLVAKRSIRKWNDEEAALNKVRKARKIRLEAAVDMKLLSPPKFEKVCKKLGVDFEAYADYISAVSSGSTLVPESDKRPELLSVEAIGSAIASIE